MYYSAGINMSPDYQRDLVWSDEDRQALISSIMANVDIGKFVVSKKPYSEWTELGYGLEIIDGKQRLDTLVRFYQDEFKWESPKGPRLFSELQPLERSQIESHPIPYAELDDATEEQILRIFLMVNTHGHVVEKAHLDRVRDRYDEVLKIK